MRDRASWLARWLRARARQLPLPAIPVLVVALLGFGAIGIAQRGQVSLESSGPSRYVPFLVAALLVVGIVSVLVVIAMAGNRGEIGKPPLRIVGPVVIGGLSLIVVSFIIGNNEPETEEELVRRTANEGGNAPFWAWGIVLSFIALVGALFLFWVRLRRSLLAEDSDPLGDLALSRQAATVIAAGRQALQRTASTRDAVIACFAEMEAALARAGVERRIADTPAELLGRASARGLLSAHGADAADDLAGLYHRARFSGRALPDTARADAERALTTLEAEFADPRQPASEQPS